MDKLTKDFMKLEGGLVVILALLVALACCMTSCKSIEYVPVIEHKTDTVIQTKVQKDSLFLHDSVYVKEKGDSVLIERWHTKYITRERHDTTYISKTDTIPVPYPVTKYVEKQVHDTTYVATHDTIPQPYPIETIKMVEKELNWWQRLRLWIGNIGLLAILGVIGYYGVKLWRVYKFF